MRNLHTLLAAVCTRRLRDLSTRLGSFKTDLVRVQLGRSHTKSKKHTYQNLSATSLVIGVSSISCAMTRGDSQKDVHIVVLGTKAERRICVALYNNSETVQNVERAALQIDLIRYDAEHRQHTLHELRLAHRLM